MTTTVRFTPVTSSNLSGLFHDPETKTLSVQFKNGTIYAYQNVDTQLYLTVLNAESVGSAFNNLIKKHPDLYPFSKEEA